MTAFETALCCTCTVATNCGGWLKDALMALYRAICGQEIRSVDHRSVGWPLLLLDSMLSYFGSEVVQGAI